MTGPPYVTETGKTSPARAGHPMPEAASTTVYQLSLASVLPWLEGDRALKKSNTVTSNISNASGNSGGSNHSGSGGSIKPYGITAALSSGAASNSHGGSKLYNLAASTTNLVVNNPSVAISSVGNGSAQSGATSKIYNIQLPVLYPSRGLRPYGSFSSASGVGSGGSVVGSAGAGRPGSEYSTGPYLLPPPSQGPSHSSSQTSLTPGQKPQTLALIIRGRGLSRTPIDDYHPIENIKDSDLLTRTYGHNVQKAIESHYDTPCSSGRSSPTITETRSPHSVSQGGWTTGNTTERSSLDSSYSLDDFDKQAANTVCQHFEEIEAVLFEGPREPLTPQADVARECQEWSSQFPHLRLLGKQACPPKDTGYHYHPSPHGSRPASSSLLLDVTDNDISLSSDSQGLSLTGQSVSVTRAPFDSLSGKDENSSAYSFLVEEVIDEDGLYEDVIAVDYKNIYEDNMEYKKQITPRRRRVGYPPITPNACVKDSVTSGAFDHIWQEIMSWMRQLLKKYTSEVTDSRHDVISFSPNPNQSTSMSREISLIMQNSRQHSFQRSNTHVGGTMERSIDGILQISSMPLQNRHQLMDPTESHVLGSARPGSSMQAHAQPRPASHLRSSHRGTRVGRLAPLAKTPNMEEDKTSRHAAIDALRVKRLTPMSNDPLPSPPSNFHRNGALPPLEMDRPQIPQQRRLAQNYRATSAIDNKDMRLLSFRDRTHLAAEQNRPNTTHAMRSETPFGYQNRRSSTPLGNIVTARNVLLSANKSLDVRGNSLQHGGDTSHFHPDIQEDQQEGPGEDIYRTHWNNSQPSHSVYRRPRLSQR